jgi:hypothetical protein
MTSLNDLVKTLNSKDHACLSLSWFAQATGRPADQELFMELMDLSAMKDGPIRAYGLYTAPSGDQYAIEGDEFKEFLTNRFIVCPEDGEIVDDVDRITIYWAGTGKVAQDAEKSTSGTDVSHKDLHEHIQKLQQTVNTLQDACVKAILVRLISQMKVVKRATEEREDIYEDVDHILSAMIALDDKLEVSREEGLTHPEM